MSKNRQSGFIKKYSSVKSFQSQAQPKISILQNESFSKFQDQFSSFHYKYPHDQSDNEFSLFHLRNITQKPPSGLIKKQHSRNKNDMKQNSYFNSNSIIDEQNQADDYCRNILNQSQQDDFRQTHKKFPKNNYTKNQYIASNYYSNSTTQANKTNKISVNQNKLKQNHQNQQDQDQQNKKNHLIPQRKKYQVQSNIPQSKKNVGKLRCNSRQNIKIDQNQIFQNRKNKIEQRTQKINIQYQKQTKKKITKVRSHENIFQFQKEAINTQKINSKEFKSNQGEQEDQYKIKRQSKSKPIYQSNNTQSNNNNRPLKHAKFYPHSLPFNNNLNNKPSMKQVSQSSVIQSEPSFLQQRMKQIQRRKFELLEKKRELEQLKQKSKQMIERTQIPKIFKNQYKQNQRHQDKYQNLQEEDSKNLDYQEDQYYQTVSKPKDTLQTKFQNIQRKQILNILSIQKKAVQIAPEYEISSESSAEQQQQQQKQQILSESLPSSLQSLSSQRPSEKSIRFLQKNYQKESSFQIQDYHQPEKTVKYSMNDKIQQKKIKEDPQIPIQVEQNKIQSKFKRPELIVQEKSKVSQGSQIKQIQQNPIQIIKIIQKRNQQLKKQDLKSYYEKQGITVAKGGITFDIDAKNFVYPEQNLQNQQPAYSPTIKSNEPTVHQQGYNSNKNILPLKKSKKQNINAKEQLKRRRQLAKSYDKYARHKVFG